jgi:hypothetical protein
MDPIWQDLPLDIVLQHILPKCDIDTRRAFKIKPRKMDLKPFKTGSFDASMKLRYVPNPFESQCNMQYVYIPMPTIAGWSTWERNENDNFPIRFATVNLSIWYNWGRFMKEKEDWDTMKITVSRIDQRDNSVKRLANIYIR